MTFKYRLICFCFRYRIPTPATGKLSPSSDSESQTGLGAVANPPFLPQVHDVGTNTPPSFLHIPSTSQVLRPPHHPLSRQTNTVDNVSENGSSPILRNKNEAKFAAENQNVIRSQRLRHLTKKTYKE